MYFRSLCTISRGVTLEGNLRTFQANKLASIAIPPTEQSMPPFKNVSTLAWSLDLLYIEYKPHISWVVAEPKCMDSNCKQGISSDWQ